MPPAPIHEVVFLKDGSDKIFLRNFPRNEWNEVKKILTDELAPYFINHICLDNNKERISSPWVPALIKKYYNSQRVGERKQLLDLITISLNFDNITLNLKDKSGHTAIDWLTISQLESLIFSPAEIVLKDLLVNSPKTFIKTIKHIIVKAHLNKLHANGTVTFPTNCQFCHTVATDKEKLHLLKEFHQSGILFNNEDNTVNITLNANSAKRIFSLWQFLILHRGKYHFPEVEKVIEEIHQEIQKAQHNQWGIPLVESPALDIANVLFAIVRGSVKVLSELKISETSYLKRPRKSRALFPKS